MKMVSVRRCGGEQADAAVDEPFEGAVRSPLLKAPSWAPSKLVVAIEAITTAAEPGSVAQWRGGGERPAAAQLARPATAKKPSWENMPK